ncbi:hypothetical protein H7F33_13465 [Pedobacter sp. PAMC26386]|nr:hypothetical protein H7F33_13465 [Pedobacter sp. PAMC26386]
MMNKTLFSALNSYLKSMIALVLTAFICSCTPGKSVEQYQATVVSAQTGVREIKSDCLKVEDLPASITYKGKPVKIRSWKDKLGDNLLLLTETGEFGSKDSLEYPDNRDAELYAYHFTKNGTTWKLIATVNDHIGSCPVDIVTSFIPEALFITDLDGNGVAECTFAYLLTCTGGVDNKVMKLIMLENKNKYIIRGTTTVHVGETIPGTMKDEAGIPERFKVFMIAKWKVFETEKSQ